MPNTITLSIPSEWADEWANMTYGGEPVSALADTTVEAVYSDEGELEHFNVSDGHWGSPDDLEAEELEAAIDRYGGNHDRT